MDDSRIGAAASDRNRQTRLVLLAALLLVIAGALAYSNALTNRFIGIDTLQAVRDNPDIRSLTPLWSSLSLTRTGKAAANDNTTVVRRPVLSFSFALNYALLGPAAWGFQLVNVAIHVTAALFLFGIVRWTLAFAGYEDPQHRLSLGFAVAVLWVVHPLTTEAVTNIVQRAESLMGLFAFLTLYSAIRAWTAPDRSSRWRWCAVAFVACALGMGTKEVMVVVPVLVWLYDVLFVSRSFVAPLRRRGLFYLALASTWLVVAVMVGLTLENSAREFDPNRIGAYLLSQPFVLMHYLRLAFWPYPLFHYIIGDPFSFRPGVDAWFGLVLYAVPVAGLGIATLWAISRLYRLGFLGAWFFLPLSLTSLLATFTLIQEHRMYLSLAAVIAATVVAADAAIARFGGRVGRLLLASLLVIAVAGLAYGTRLRNDDYRSDLTLWAPADLPLAFTMLSNLAMYYQRVPEAEAVFETMLAASEQPAHPLSGHNAAALNGLGAVRALQGRLDEAQSLFAKALERDPSYAVAENNLAVVLFADGQREAAQQRLRRVLAADKGFNYVAVPTPGRNDPLLVPVVSWLSEDQRQGLARADLSALNFAIVLNPPDQEFSIDFKLGVNVREDAVPPS